MKKLLFHFTIIMLAAMTLTSCGNKQQAETEQEVPLKVTYSIDCSKDLLDMCDLVVTYKGDDGVNVTDTITASPVDSIETLTWTKTVGTHEIPVKIGLDYAFVQKTDSLLAEEKMVSLHAEYTIIAEKIGIRKGIAHLSEKAINSKTSFYVNGSIMEEKFLNTSSNLATIIDIYNDRQAYKRGTANSKTCFIINPNPYGKGLIVENACWND